MRDPIQKRLSLFDLFSHSVVDTIFFRVVVLITDRILADPITSATKVLVLNTPPALDGVEEVDEAGYDTASMRGITDFIKEFTTLDDDDNATVPTASLVETQPALGLSPSRVRALPKPKKRNRAETMSSNASKEGKSDEQKPGNSASPGRKSSSECQPLVLFVLAHVVHRRGAHDRACTKTQEGHGRRHRFHRLWGKGFRCARQGTRCQPLRLLRRNRQRGRLPMLTLIPSDSPVPSPWFVHVRASLHLSESFTLLPSSLYVRLSFSSRPSHVP